MPTWQWMLVIVAILFVLSLFFALSIARSGGLADEAIDRYANERDGYDPNREQHK
jgi:hypothetical protein